MIIHSPTSHPGAAPSDHAESADRDHRDHRDHRDASERSGEGDPFRLLFHRHANHVNSAQTRNIQARLRSRLFAEDRERG